MTVVWSLTPFFNELDVFEIRLAELDPVVDVHVVAESTLTYSGDPKPLFFLDALRSGRYRRWEDKIRYVVVDDSPEGKDGRRPKNSFDPHGGMAWVRENHQRDALQRGCDGMADDDVVILSDADEIPSANFVEDWLLYRSDQRKHGAVDRVFMPQHVMYLNWQWREPTTIAVCRVTDGDTLLNYGPERVRKNEAGMLHRIHDGWHFSYMGGPAAISYKIRSAAHEELNQPRWTDRAAISSRLERRLDMFDRATRRPVPVPVSELPAHVQENVPRFAHMLDLGDGRPHEQAAA